MSRTVFVCLVLGWMLQEKKTAHSINCSCSDSNDGPNEMCGGITCVFNCGSHSTERSTTRKSSRKWRRNNAKRVRCVCVSARYGRLCAGRLCMCVCVPDAMPNTVTLGFFSVFLSYAGSSEPNGVIKWIFTVCLNEMHAQSGNLICLHVRCTPRCGFLFRPAAHQHANAHKHTYTTMRASRTS